MQWLGRRNQQHNKMKTKKLPQQIVVTVCEEGTENEFLSVGKTADAVAEQGVVKRGGIYVLKELINIEGVSKVTPGK